MRRCSHLVPVGFALFLLHLGGGRSDSAPISWGEPFDIVSVDDISLNGEIVTAVNATADAVEPAVTVGGEVIVFRSQSFPPPVGVTPTVGFFTSEGGDTGNFELNQVLDSHAFAGPGWRFDLTGLTPGLEYQVQIIAGGDRRQPLEQITQRAGDGESPESISGNMRRGGVGSVLGTFVADGPTQTIVMHEGTVFPQLPAISGFVLRRLTPPTPPSDVLLSSTRIDPDSGPETLIGLLSAVDVNPQGTHVFQLVDHETYPDNDRFEIVYGNRFRADSILGEVGSTYEVMIRATDSGGLSANKVFILKVEPPPPILTFDYSPSLAVLTTENVSGRAIGVAYSEDLASGSWLELGNFFELDGVMTFFDPDQLRLSRRRGYYRAFMRPLIP